MEAIAMKRMVPALMTMAALAAGAANADAASLRGSRAQMEQQNMVARQHELAFYRTGEEIGAAVERGDLVPLRGNDDYDVADFVRYPYAHPAAVLFVERLSAQYREECGQKLVVTSAVRPTSGQPRNAHELSVHPAGMALDLRVSDRAACRSWLEGALMNLERRGVINGIREYNPPHYHVAVYPEQYAAYAAERMASEPAALAADAAGASAAAAPAAAAPAPTGSQAAVAAASLSAGIPLGTRIAMAAMVILALGLPIGHQAVKDRRRALTL
jgi:hypothetical protein